MISLSLFSLVTLITLMLCLTVVFCLSMYFDSNIMAKELDKEKSENQKEMMANIFAGAMSVGINKKKPTGSQLENPENIPY